MKKLRYFDKSPSFYQHYASLFSNYFPEISKTIIEELDNIGYEYYHSILLLDSIVDESITKNLPQMVSLQEDAIKRLSQIFSYNCVFWKFWERRKYLFFEAISQEKQLNYKNSNWTKYAKIADNKSAFGKIAIDCLFFLSCKKDETLYNALLESHKNFSIGFQLYDDVCDFVHDLQNNQYNWGMQTMYIKDVQTSSDIEKNGKIFYLSGIACRTLEKSIRYLKKAIYILKYFDCESDWIKTILKTISTIRTYISNINGYINSIRIKTKLLKSVNEKPFLNLLNCNKVFMDGLKAVAIDYKRNYGELKHIMHLSKQDGFKNKNEIHVSDIFQRAFIDNYLFDIASKYNSKTSEYFNNETQYFINSKKNDSIGVWSYFPTVKELSSDIDDLGEIVRYFILVNRFDLIESICRKGILTAVQNQTKEGGIQTWILPKNKLSCLQKIQQNFNDSKWGNGPDIEVTANFVYSLFLYKPQLYDDLIAKALEYLVKNQNANGSWNCRWYSGQYYGTFVCLRLLFAINDHIKYKDTLMSALSFLLNSQNNNGSFSTDGKESVISTAFALKCMKYYPDKTKEAMSKAKKFLISTQSIDGCWEAETFIKPRLSETYKSKTLSTVIVLHSLL